MSDNQNQDVVNEEVVQQPEAEAVETPEVGSTSEEGTTESTEGEKDTAAAEGGTEGEADSKEEPETIDGLEIPKPDLEDDGDDVDDIKKQRDKWAQLRIQQREEKRKQEEERRALEIEHEKLIQAQSQQAVAQFAARAPNRDDFADDAEYHEAMVHYTVAKRDVEMRTSMQTRAVLQAQQKLKDDINEINNKGASSYSDYHSVVDPLFDPRGDMPVNIDLVKAVNASKYGHHILYMLGKNKARAKEIASMSGLDAARWVWETEKKYEEAKTKPKIAASDVKIMPKINTKGAPHEKSIGEMTVAEYAAWWKKRQYGK